MPQLSAKLWGDFAKDGTTVTAIYYLCPGCNDIHRVQMTADKLQWDGNVNAPTLFSEQFMSVASNMPQPFCHSTVNGGMIQFFPDSQHYLAGKTMPMPDWPQRAKPYQA